MLTRLTLLIGCYAAVVSGDTRFPLTDAVWRSLTTALEQWTSTAKYAGSAATMLSPEQPFDSMRLTSLRSGDLLLATAQSPLQRCVDWRGMRHVPPVPNDTQLWPPFGNPPQQGQPAGCRNYAGAAPESFSCFSTLYAPSIFAGATFDSGLFAWTLRQGRILIGKLLVPTSERDASLAQSPPTPSSSSRESHAAHGIPVVFKTLANRYVRQRDRALGALRAASLQGASPIVLPPPGFEPSAMANSLPWNVTISAPCKVFVSYPSVVRMSISAPRQSVAVPWVADVAYAAKCAQEQTVTAASGPGVVTAVQTRQGNVNVSANLAGRYSLTLRTVLLQPPRAEYYSLVVLDVGVAGDRNCSATWSDADLLSVRARSVKGGARYVCSWHRLSNGGMRVVAVAPRFEEGDPKVQCRAPLCDEPCCATFFECLLPNGTFVDTVSIVGEISGAPDDPQVSCESVTAVEPAGACGPGYTLDGDAQCRRSTECPACVHGECDAMGSCVCNDGYVGANCSVPVVCDHGTIDTTTGRCQGLCDLGYMDASPGDCAVCQPPLVPMQISYDGREECRSTALAVSGASPVPEGGSLHLIVAQASFDGAGNVALSRRAAPFSLCAEAHLTRVSRLLVCDERASMVKYHEALAATSLATRVRQWSVVSYNRTTCSYASFASCGKMSACFYSVNLGQCLPCAAIQQSCAESVAPLCLSAFRQCLGETSGPSTLTSWQVVACVYASFGLLFVIVRTTGQLCMLRRASSRRPEATRALPYAL